MEGVLAVVTTPEACDPGKIRLILFLRNQRRNLNRDTDEPFKVALEKVAARIQDILVEEQAGAAAPGQQKRKKKKQDPTALRPVPELILDPIFADNAAARNEHRPSASSCSDVFPRLQCLESPDKKIRIAVVQNPPILHALRLFGTPLVGYAR